MKATVKTIAGQPCWVAGNENVELAVTRLGGHMAPVTFYRASKKPIRPYYVSPWQAEGLKIDEPVLVPLRGDFFCMPFGVGCEYRGERHVAHGSPATKRWAGGRVTRRGGVTTLTMTMTLRERPGKVTKRLGLVKGHNVIYDKNVIEGFAGPTTLAHHATLAMPEEQESVLVATSPYRFGMTNPTPTSDPPGGEYQALAVGRRFRSLDAVPTLFAEPKTADCTRLPTRKGFTDLASVANDPRVSPAWTAATFTTEGFVWFALKDPAVLPLTVLWMSNHGRHMPPWSGRNACLGLEDVCGLLAEGLVPSLRPNALTKAGVPTTLRLRKSKPTVVNYIQGVVRVPRGFGKVREARFDRGKVTFVGAARKKVTARLRHEFLTTGQL